MTGEDVLELHVHGGPATVKAVLSAIPRTLGTQRIRYAEPGEFTKRAFFNDRLDLAQIESLSDTLAAETEQQRRAAVRGNSGALGRTYEAWREQLLQARGEIEALIDFSEDQHFDESQSELLVNVTAQIQKMLQSIQMHERGSQRSELLRSGIRIALLGPPNVGKSSLMNLIVGREASIVSGEAGTTRDIVEASLDVRGYLCSFADTAGFRSQASADRKNAPNAGPIGAIEEEGIRRAKQRAQDSDIVVVVASIEQGTDGPFVYYDQETLDLAAKADACMLVVNKVESAGARAAASLGSFRESVSSKCPSLVGTEMVSISCKDAHDPAVAVGAATATILTPSTTTTATGTGTGTGTGTAVLPARNAPPATAADPNGDPGGIQAFTDSLVRAFSSMTAMPADLQDLLGVTERQRQLLAQCRRHLEDFMMEAQQQSDDESEARPDADTVLAAEHLRYAADCLARITGRGESGDVEDVLGVVFEK